MLTDEEYEAFSERCKTYGMSQAAALQLQRVLSRLCREGILIRKGKGSYCLAKSDSGNGMGR